MRPTSMDLERCVNRHGHPCLIARAARPPSGPRSRLLRAVPGRQHGDRPRGRPRVGSSDSARLLAGLAPTGGLQAGPRYWRQPRLRCLLASGRSLLYARSGHAGAAAAPRGKGQPERDCRWGDNAEADATRPRSAPGGRIDGSEQGERWQPRRALPGHMGASEARVLGSSFPRKGGPAARSARCPRQRRSRSGPDQVVCWHDRRPPAHESVIYAVASAPGAAVLAAAATGSWLSHRAPTVSAMLASVPPPASARGATQASSRRPPRAL